MSHRKLEPPRLLPRRRNPPPRSRRPHHRAASTRHATASGGNPSFVGLRHAPPRPSVRSPSPFGVLAPNRPTSKSRRRAPFPFRSLRPLRPLPSSPPEHLLLPTDTPTSTYPAPTRARLLATTDPRSMGTRRSHALGRKRSPNPPPDRPDHATASTNSTRTATTTSQAGTSCAADRITMRGMPRTRQTCPTTPGRNHMIHQHCRQSTRFIAGREPTHPDVPSASRADARTTPSPTRRTIATDIGSPRRGRPHLPLQPPRPLLERIPSTTSTPSHPTNPALGPSSPVPHFNRPLAAATLRPHGRPHANNAKNSCPNDSRTSLSRNRLVPPPPSTSFRQRIVTRQQSLTRGSTRERDQDLAARPRRQPRTDDHASTIHDR